MISSITVKGENPKKKNINGLDGKPTIKEIFTM
jgi:hypothetical protein